MSFEIISTIYYYYYYYITCHRPFLPGTSLLDPAVIPTAQASNCKLQSKFHITELCHVRSITVFCIIIIIIISFTQGIYTYIPETHHVPRQHSVAAILYLLFMVHKSYFQC